MQDGCKVYMDSYMASNGSCFMVTWTIFKNHLLEVGLMCAKPGDPGTLNDLQSGHFLLGSRNFMVTACGLGP